MRLKSVRYPNSRLVHLTYGSSGSAADNLARLDAIKDDSSGSPGTTIASYTWLGIRQMVIEDFEQPDLRLDFFGGVSGTYAGWDRFDRVIDQRWYDYGASADRDRFQYGYDRIANRNYRENTVSKNLGTPVYLDEYYTYDGLYRLKNTDRGQLNGTKTAIIGTPSREEDWTLDALGNWTGLVQKTSGTTDLNQSRTANKVNEITDITETTGTAWITPGYDRAGNMTTVPKPSSLANGYTVKWDAWNRLVEVKDGATVIGVYEYDGVDRRVKKHIDSQAPDAPNGIDRYEHHFYNTVWQLLETRDTTAESNEPENLQPKYQYVWSPRYIDGPILRDENTDADDLCDDQRLYSLADANMIVTALVDMFGEGVERYVYEPYGMETIYDGTWSSTRSTSSYANVRKFGGYHFDLETCLYHVRHRVLHPGVTWLSRDPLEGDVSLYSYADGRATLTADPSGLRPCVDGGYPPGTATCGGTSKGRGIFSLISMGRYQGEEEDWVKRIGSDMWMQWLPAPAAFIDRKGCCCCKLIGYLQIHSSASSYGKRIFVGGKWEVDGGLAYPEGTTGNPCLKNAQSITLTDSPNAPWRFRGVGVTRLGELQQWFWTCVVCLSGCESPNWELTGWSEQFAAGTFRLKGITSYGCVNWGHRIKWSKEEARYIYSRFLLGDQAASDDENSTIIRRNVVGVEPPSIWWDTVNMHSFTL